MFASRLLGRSLLTGLTAAAVAALTPTVAHAGGPLALCGEGQPFLLPTAAATLPSTPTRATSARSPTSRGPGRRGVRHLGRGAQRDHDLARRCRPAGRCHHRQLCGVPRGGRARRPVGNRVRRYGRDLRRAVRRRLGCAGLCRPRVRGRQHLRIPRGLLVPQRPGVHRPDLRHADHGPRVRPLPQPGAHAGQRRRRVRRHQRPDAAQ